VKRTAALLLTLCMLLGTMTAACAEDNFDAFYSMEFPFILFNADTHYNDPWQLFFFDGVEDLPWIDLEELADFINDIQTEFYDETDYRLTYSEEGPLYTLTRENGYCMQVDCDENTIAFDDYNAFLKDPSDSALLDQLSHSGYNSAGEADLFQRDARASFDRYGDVMTLALNDYGLSVRSREGRCYLPLQTANDFVLSPMFSRSILFNGEGMYFADGDELFNDDGITPMGEMYYAVEPADRSQELADFGYYELCMMLDNLYGLKEQHDIESFDNMFWQVGFDEALRSTSAEDADTALRNFIVYYLDDLHSAYDMPSWMTGLKDVGDNYGPSIRLDDIQTKKYAALRSKGMGDDFEAYEEVGNTAYITFDEFTVSYEDYYETAEQGGTVSDTIGLMIYARQQIYREDSPIENVVIDLSNNGGGKVDAAVFVISWILGEAEISLEDVFTGAQSTLVYRADVNLDRRFDEQDTLYDKNVYCLISPVSFSCGNLVPAVCKYHQAVTLIGRTSGGGACTVQPMSTAWGTTFQISGAHRLSFRKNGSFYDIDEGVDPDIYIDHLETLYDRQALTELINRLD